MRNRKHIGFTLVELLIAIVIIAILASIATVAYAGMKTRADNQARFTELKSYVNLLKAYKAVYGKYPDIPYTAPESGSHTAAGYCLGTDFPNGYCRDYGGGHRYVDPAVNTDATPPTSNDVVGPAYMNSELSKVGTLPKTKHIPVNNSVGPYVGRFLPNTILVATAIQGTQASDCPQDTQGAWVDPVAANKRVICEFYLDIN